MSKTPLNQGPIQKEKGGERTYTNREKTRPQIPITPPPPPDGLSRRAFPAKTSAHAHGARGVPLAPPGEIIIHFIVGNKVTANAAIVARLQAIVTMLQQIVQLRRAPAG